jgi:hypothetical protein
MRCDAIVVLCEDVTRADACADALWCDGDVMGMMRDTP